MQDIQIICRAPGMRRCGIVHPAVAVYQAGRWSEAELKRFRADPLFEVRDASPVSESSALAAAGASEAPTFAASIGVDADRKEIGRIVIASGAATILSYAGAELFRRGVGDEPDFLAIDVTTQIDIVLETADGQVLSAAALTEKNLATLGGVAEGATTTDEVLGNGAGATEPALDGKPRGDVDRPAAIVDAIGALTDNEKTQAGRPKVAVLEEKLGFRPTSEEIDAALAAGV